MEIVTFFFKNPSIFNDILAQWFRGISCFKIPSVPADELHWICGKLLQSDEDVCQFYVYLWLDFKFWQTNWQSTIISQHIFFVLPEISSKN
jgi:hypothetical protein